MVTSAGNVERSQNSVAESLHVFVVARSIGSRVNDSRITFVASSKERELTEAANITDAAQRTFANMVDLKFERIQNENKSTRNFAGASVELPNLPKKLLYIIGINIGIGVIIILDNFRIPNRHHHHRRHHRIVTTMI